MKDIEALIKLIEWNSTSKDINLQNLTIIGHSSGGLTSIESCRKFKALKYCISLDPYFMPYADEVNSGSYKIN